jgi:hypothetical protein
VLHALQQNAAASTEILFSYGELINKVGGWQPTAGPGAEDLKQGKIV